MSGDEVEEVVRGLSAEEQRILLDFNPDWHGHFRADEVIAVGRLGGLGLLTFQNSYEGPTAMQTDLGRQVAERLSRA